MATRSILATTGLLAAATLLAVGSASATSEAGAVLTYGSPGGTDVAVGDTIAASNSGTVKIATAPGGSTGVTCSQSSFSADVVTNPPAPGTATESLKTLTFGNCTSNIVGVTGVRSITPNGLPRPASVSSSGVVSIEGPLSTTAVLISPLTDITCTYAAPSMSGTADNATNSISFVDQEFTLSSGGGLCPGAAYLTGTYSPVKDTTVAGGPSVYVN